MRKRNFGGASQGIRLAIAGLTLLACSNAVKADTVSRFVLTGNNGLCGCAEDVRADFTAMGNGDLQVVLTNLVDSFYDRQVLTGIQFGYAGSGNSAGSVGSQTPGGNSLYDIIDSTGTLTAVAGSLTAWHTELDLAPYVTLTNLGGPGARGGAQGILGSGTTGAVNHLSSHDPFALGSVSIVIHNLAGIDANTSIESARFNFGTALDNFVSSNSSVNTFSDLSPRIVTFTPEPGTFVMFSTGAVLLGLSRRRRSSKR